MQVHVPFGIKPFVDIPYVHYFLPYTAFCCTCYAIVCTAQAYYHSCNQVLSPVTDVVILYSRAVWQAASRQCVSTCTQLRCAGSALMVLIISLTTVVLHLAATATCLIFLVVTEALLLSLWLVPVLGPLVGAGCLHKSVRTWWTHPATQERYRHITAAVRRQQQTAIQAFTFHKQATLRQVASDIPVRVQRTTSAITLCIREILLNFVSSKLFQKRRCCVICLQDTPISDILQLENCNHSYCKACVAMHLQVKLRDKQAHVLRCPVPGCTGAFAMQQCQDALLHDTVVRTCFVHEPQQNEICGLLSLPF